MKKICIVAASGGTITSFMIKHIEYLSRQFNVTVVVGDEIAQSLDVKINRIVISRKINLIQDIKSLFKLYSFFKKENFDIVLSVTPKAGLLSMLASFFSGVNIRIHFFTGQVWATKKGLFRSILKAMDHLIVKTSSHILVDSISQRDFLNNENILDRSKKGTVLKNGSISGVNIEKFKQNLMIKEELKEEYGLHDEIVFMFVGRLNEDKGILDLSNVFDTLLNKYPERIKLFLVGSAEDAIENYIGKLLKHDNVIRIGYVPDPERILNLADVLLLPSYREGFGTIVIEAASMKIPTIGSDIYGLNDAIVNNKTGLLHLKADREDMIKKYEYIIHNRYKIKEYGAFAYDRVMKDFQDNDLSQALLDYILKIEAENNA